MFIKGTITIELDVRGQPLVSMVFYGFGVTKTLVLLVFNGCPRLVWRCYIPLLKSKCQPKSGDPSLQCSGMNIDSVWNHQYFPDDDERMKVRCNFFLLGKTRAGGRVLPWPWNETWRLLHHIVKILWKHCKCCKNIAKQRRLVVAALEWFYPPQHQFVQQRDSREKLLPFYIHFYIATFQKCLLKKTVLGSI